MQDQEGKYEESFRQKLQPTNANRLKMDNSQLRDVWMAVGFGSIGTVGVTGNIVLVTLMSRTINFTMTRAGHLARYSPRFIPHIALSYDAQ
uniref:Uncharacterized protein n=1 Tax=Romanomermis culicivorax TaxID=13658 RepID=A0A915KHQ9_ROMCU